MWAVKAYKRKPGRYITIYKLLLLLVSLGASFLVHYFLEDSPHLIWAVRLTVVVVASIHVWATYIQPLAKRDKYKYENDSFAPEFVFTALEALLVSISFALSPQLFKLIEYRVDVSAALWDLPLVFLLPFLVFKLTDFASQIPYRVIENPWIFPLEPVNVENWPWRNLMQVNFQLKKSLLDEYRLFRAPAKPWIEAPKEIPLGEVFRLVIQERRRRPDLTTIQDMGDEYAGDARFWWLFSIKVKWWNPATWIRNPRYLNPDQSIAQNKVQKNDVILLRRIPREGTDPQNFRYREHEGYDPDKTVIIHK